MKRISYLVLFLAALVMSAGTVSGQERQQRRQHKHDGESRSEMRFKGLDLSDEQKEEINDLRIGHMKEVQAIRNELGEKRARLRTLTTGDNQDLNSINALIDEMGELRTEMQKMNVKHRLDVREVLTDEQKVIFDSHSPGFGKKGFRDGGRRRHFRGR